MSKKLLNAVKLNAAKIDENDESIVMFDTPQVITNSTRQKDGSYYDMESLDTNSLWSGQIMADHGTDFKSRVGTAINVVKDAAQVTIDGIKFALSNPDGRLARDMLLENMVEFSIATIGDWEKQDGKRENHSIYETSIVGIGNNNDTKMNDIRAFAAQNGFDLKKYNIKSEDTMTDEEEKAAEAAADEAEAKAKEAEEAEQKKVADLEAKVNSFEQKLKDLEKPADKDALENADEVEKTNGFKKTGEKMEDKFKKMNASQRLNRQIDLQRGIQMGSGGAEELRALNEFNAELRAKEGLEVKENSLTSAVGSGSGLIAPAELDTEISQCVDNRYSDFLNEFTFQPSDLLYQWNLGFGEADYQIVGHCDPSSASTFETGKNLRVQERLNTHTIICDAVTRFSPVNIVPWIANSFVVGQNKAKVKYALARMQKAVDLAVTGITRVNNPVGSVATINVAPRASASVTYPAAGQVTQIAAIQGLFVNASMCAEGGVFVMNKATAAKLIRDMNIGVGGVSQTSNGTVVFNQYTALGAALGGQVLIVPADVLPTLGTAETRTVSIRNDAGLIETVTINHAIFYASGDNWRGLTSETPDYEISSVASIEEPVEVTVGVETVTITQTRSLWQRKETAILSEIWRGGDVKDFREISAVKAQTV